MRKSPSKSKTPPNRAPAAAAALILMTLALYWPALRCGFINYDDMEYVTEVTHVTSGLSLENARWAMGNGFASNWYPVTWLSHMADSQLYGLKPWGHHLTSVLLHALNAALVFALLQQMTGATVLSLLAAALFAAHPLRVESVAWVAERKDVLSGFFGLLALVFYARRRHLLSLLFFALGLMSKPMLVTWPFVMLLLDYWPLRRLQPATAWRSVREKTPFFALAAAASVVAFMMQKRGGAMATTQSLSLGARAGNAVISYCRYLGKLFWPTDLAVIYPHPGHWPMASVLLAGGSLAGISALLFTSRKRYPFLLMGWLWFCGTLVPVIGLVQVGRQSIADRYTYIPAIGIFVAVIWGAKELAQGGRYRRIALSCAGAAAILLCMALTRTQLGYWKDSEPLFRHALAVTRDNGPAHFHLGRALAENGRLDEAVGQFKEALRLSPDDFEARNNLGNALSDTGEVDEAIAQFQEALRLDPGYAKAHNNLGNALDKKGRTDEAISQYQEAIRLKPDYAEAHSNLGAAFHKEGRIDEALSRYGEAIRLKPDYAMAHYNLGTALGESGRLDEAIGQFQETLRLEPDNSEAHNNLGTALAQKGRTEEAIAQYQEALRLNPDRLSARENLGVLLGRKRRIAEAPR